MILISLVLTFNQWSPFADTGGITLEWRHSSITLLFVQQLLTDKNNDHIKFSHYWPFLRWMFNDMESVSMSCCLHELMKKQLCRPYFTKASLITMFMGPTGGPSGASITLIANRPCVHRCVIKLMISIRSVGPIYKRGPILVSPLQLM